MGITRDYRLIQLSGEAETDAAQCASRIGAPVKWFASGPKVGRLCMPGFLGPFPNGSEWDTIGHRMGRDWETAILPALLTAETRASHYPRHSEIISLLSDGTVSVAIAAQRLTYGGMTGFVERAYVLRQECAAISAAFAPDLTYFFYARRFLL